MADEAIIEEPAPGKRKRSPFARALSWLGWLALALVGLVLLLVAFLHTPPGRQFIVDEIAKVAPASGLKVEVGSIDGSVLWSATLNDVKLRDANDVLFLEVPTVDLNWRPHRWFTSGLDVRHLVLTGGTLYAAPTLNPGDPDAPVLPDFDIRVDRFVIDDLTVAEGLLGEERVIDYSASADIRDGLLKLESNGELGGADVFTVNVEAEPDGDLFDLDVKWNAPRGGFLATMVGARDDLSLALVGDGSWTSWEGDLLAEQGDMRLLDFDIYNEGGQYRIVGEARPGTYLEGITKRALGEVVALTASGTLENSVLEGDFVLRGQGVNADGVGAIDLSNNRFRSVNFAAQLLDPTLFNEDVALNGAVIEGTLNGAFRDLSVPHTLRVAELDASGIIVTDLYQQGVLTYDGVRFSLPVEGRVGRIVSGNELFDPRLLNGTVRGNLLVAGGEVLSDNLDVRFPGLVARLGLSSDLENGRTLVNGPVDIADLPFDNVGNVDARARIRFTIGGGAPWQLAADLDGRVDEVTNATLANLTGGPIRFDGGLALGSGQPLAFNDFNINSAKLTATLDGTVDEGGTSVAGYGRHVDYGPFTVEATLADDGPRAVLVLADPLPAAGLKDVRVALAPQDDGFNIETQGQSLLGHFDGVIDLRIAENGDTTLGITRLDVAETRVTGDLLLVDGGAQGDLLVSRGGVDGTIALAMRDGGQGFDIDLSARNARFGGATPLIIARGDIDASGVIGEGNTNVNGTANLAGVRYGNLFLGRLAAQADMQNGVGHVDAALTGRRGSRFELLVNGDIAPDRIGVAVEGSYAGREISMPRRAIVTRTDDGGWALQRSQLTYGDGFVVAEGRMGGTAPIQGRVALSKMPLALTDALAGELGVGGTISGIVDLAEGANGLPTGEARVQIAGLTRSSSLLSSQPLNIALVGRLSETLLQARAVMSDATGADGRLQARIARLPASGSLPERLYAGDLFAQLRFDGSAASLWRLAAIDLMDVTGNLEVAANVRGTLGNPQVRGSMRGDDLRVRSALTGSDVTGVKARARFSGSKLFLSSFSGNAPNGGTISGSGTIDLSGMSAARGPRIDLRMAARNAEVLDLETMSATVTGPLRIVSNGVGGTVAGRLTVQNAFWKLGVAEELAKLPSIKTTEVNLPPDIAPYRGPTSPWRYLINAKAASGIEVDGMGLDSEWRGDIRLRGTTDDPRVGGEVSIVPRQGFYSFAGVRFDITRGQIDFDENVPIDPRIDLVAETEVDGLSVAVNVRGNASQPDITFNSVPALPEEELLARLLFGGSITNLSATDALQLGAAVASLRGGSGVGPINQLRNAIGLDRLRIIPADPALDRGTSVALGKNLTRKFYVEIITDGAGYNATELEFRVTSWLSLLATVSTIGRHSAAAEYRKDY